ncbi:MAG: sulfatase-like hydrolase/transferase [Haloferacaceae archaeon]
MSDGDVGAAVLVTVDSLRADAAFDADVAAGSAGAVSSLASRGTTFENAFAHGNWTPFSFPSLLGSRHVFEDGGDIGVGAGPTLAETLSAAGVATAGFNAANGFLTGHWDYDRGFDRFRSFTADTDGSTYSRYLSAHPTVQAWLQLATARARRVGRRLRGRDHDRLPNTSRMADAVDGAVEFVESASGPFFLWVHFMDAHTPYVPDPRYVRAVTDGEFGVLRSLRAHVRAGLGRGVEESTLADLRALYRAATAQVDDGVGRVLDALERRGLRDETMVVLAGDHGEEFQEHGHLAHYPKLYDELVHVPLVVDHPDGAAGRVTGAVGLDAVAPTVCAAMGAPTGAFRGESLLESVLDPSARVADGPVFSTAVRGESVTQQPIPRHRDDGELLVSGRTSRYAYVYHTDSGRRELYDRRRDPTEQRNVWESRGGDPGPTRLAAATERYATELVAGDESGDGAAGSDDPPAAVSDRLEALGYR